MESKEKVSPKVFQPDELYPIVIENDYRSSALDPSNRWTNEITLESKDLLSNLGTSVLCGVVQDIVGDPMLILSIGRTGGCSKHANCQPSEIHDRYTEDVDDPRTYLSKMEQYNLLEAEGTSRDREYTAIDQPSPTLVKRED